MIKLKITFYNNTLITSLYVGDYVKPPKTYSYIKDEDEDGFL